MQKKEVGSSQENFEKLKKECLSKIFSETEIKEHFIIDKKIFSLKRVGENKRIQIFKVPRKINSDFVDLVSKNENFRNIFGKYMIDKLINEVRKDLKKTGKLFLFKLYLCVKELSLEEFNKDIHDLLFSKRFKMPWTVFEVSKIIESLKAKLREFGKS